MTLGITCCRCEYDLTSLAMDGSCPECGTPVAASINKRSLINVPVEKLRRLRHGLLLGVYASLVAVVVFVLLVATYDATTLVYEAVHPAVQSLLDMFFFIGLPSAYIVANLMSVFRATIPLGHETESDRSTARQVRISAIAFSAVLVFFGLASILADDSLLFIDDAVYVLLILGSGLVLAGGVCVYCSSMGMMRAILQRSHRWKTARRVRRQFVPLPVLGGICFAVGAVPSIFSLIFLPLAFLCGLAMMLVIVINAGVCAAAVLSVINAKGSDDGEGVHDVDLPDFVNPKNITAVRPS